MAALRSSPRSLNELDQALLHIPAFLHITVFDNANDSMEFRCRYTLEVDTTISRIKTDLLIFFNPKSVIYFCHKQWNFAKSGILYL